VGVVIQSNSLSRVGRRIYLTGECLRCLYQVV
jgi:hypothetical protein